MKKKASRRLVAAFTMAAMLVTLMPSGASFAAPAEEAGEATQATQATAAAKTAPKEVTGDTQEAGENQYVSYEWDYDQEQLVRTVKDIPDYATVVTQDNVNTVWSNGMIQGGPYVIEGDVTVNGPLTVNGWKTIILKDRSQLNALQGIRLENGAHLDIFAQSEKSWNMGKLYANNAEKDGYGIGGDDAGFIRIFGGLVKATGVNRPGLGASDIVIYNGDIIAKSNNQAAIGSVDYGARADIGIYGGKVDAISDTGCGIGGGRGSAEGHVGIYGGEVTAKGELGIGFYNDGSALFYGGTINVTGTKTAIGTASDYNTSGHCDRIEIHGGEVTAIGGDGYAYGIYSDSGMSILGGNVILKNNLGIRALASEVTISGGTIKEARNSGRSANIIGGRINFSPENKNSPKAVVDIGGNIGENVVQIDNADINCCNLNYNAPELLVRDSIVRCEGEADQIAQIWGKGNLQISDSKVYANMLVNGNVYVDNSSVFGEISTRGSEPLEGNVYVDNSSVFGGIITRGSEPLEGNVYIDNSSVVASIDADKKRVTINNSQLCTYESRKDIICGDLVVNNSTVELPDHIAPEGMVLHSIINAQNVNITDGFVECSGISGKLRINEGKTDSQSVVCVESLLDHSNEANWNGLVIDGGAGGHSIGKVYGPHVTIPSDVWNSGTMIVPKGATLTIPQGKTVRNWNGFVINEGTIDGGGTLGDSSSYLSGSGTVAATITNELETQGEISLTPSAESVAEGQYLTFDVKMAQMPTGLKDFHVEFYRGNTSLGSVPMKSDGTAKSDAITVRDGNGWVTGKTYPITAMVYGHYDEWNEGAEDWSTISVLLGQGTCKVNVVKPAEAAPVAPSKKAVTDTSVTLNTIAKSANGAKALYGMKSADGSFIWQDVPYFDNLKPDTDYIFAAKYDAVGNFAESTMSQEVTIRTAKSSKSDQPTPAAPVKKSVTASSVTLKTIADSSVGGKVQYGMKDATGVTKWQDSPVFENLKADTAYTFVAQYMATDKYNASAISAETVIRTAKKDSTNLLSPIILNSTGGQTAVTVTNPKPGQAVTIITAPDKGYEVDNVKVTDENGNVIEVTKNANGQYVFNQPDTQVTIKVTYKKAVTPEEPQKPEKPETPQGDDWNNPFTDVPKGAWYNDAVRYVYENGLMVGLAPNNFGANVTTDRGQLVTMLWRMAGEPQATNGADFSDVPSNAYYAKAVAWAAENGITAGFEDGTFRPQTGLSREQMAALFMNYAKATGVDTSARADISEFTDVNPDNWSYNALSWAKAVGLLAGVSDTEMAPQATATRAQIAAVLQRYCETVAK